MARLILKSPYLKPNGKRSPGGYLKYKVYGYLSTSTKNLTPTEIDRKCFPDSKSLVSKEKTDTNMILNR